MVGQVRFDKIATIANGEYISDVIDITDRSLAGVFIPGDFDGTVINFYAGPSSASCDSFLVDGATGIVETYICSANNYIPVDIQKFVGVRYVAIVIDGTGTGSQYILATLPL